MGFFNKVKNMFFEEEIVEVEEKPKKEKKDAPVAKKIELPKQEKVEKPEFDIEPIEDREEPKETKFPIAFDEDDFKEEEPTPVEDYDSQIHQTRSERHHTSSYEEKVIEEVKEEPSFEPKYDLEYGSELEDAQETHGPYEGKSPKKTFTPTPIISPIYGILDKNYKKDDVVTKKEIRLSSAPKKIDLDTVREKAYGDLTTDISQSMEDVEEDNSLNEEEDLLYDLNDENASPAIKEVTVGDAEEYFNDLGLEYNIDYKDTSVEKQKSPKEKKRRSAPEKDEEEVKEEVVEEANEDDDLVDSNLFDLIESTLYDEKE